MPRKSRGCGNCRKSRKKCDEDQPSCQFCRRNNLPCSGRIVGPIIIDQTRRVASRYEGDRGGAATNNRSIHRATVSVAFSSLFLSFVDSSASASPIIPSWLTRLQDLPLSFRSKTALDLALQATATVYCGVHANNLVVIRDACALYGQALSLHSRSMTMTQMQPNEPDGPPAAALICTSVVLSLFEAMWPSSLDGYAAHLTAARNLTCATPGLAAQTSTEEATLPTHTELLRQVYVHILYQSVLVAFTCPIECLNSGELATKSHSAVILWDPSSSDQSQPLADRLVTQLFKLGKLVCVLASGGQEAVLSFQLQAIENHVKILWDEHLQEKARRRGREETADVDVDGSSLVPAYFASTTILLSLAKSNTSSSSSSSDNVEAAIEIQHQIVLDSAARLSATPGGVSSSAYLPMYLPIALVALHSTSPERRATASELLESSSPHRQQTAIFRGLSRRIGVSVAQGSSIQLDLRHGMKQSGVRIGISG
ncbi:C6 zinc finger protein [Apiospora saccharicola]